MLILGCPDFVFVATKNEWMVFFPPLPNLAMEWESSDEKSLVDNQVYNSWIAGEFLVSKQGQ